MNPLIFWAVWADAGMEDLLHFLSHCEELQDIRIRKGERSALNDMNKSGRYRQKSKVQTTPVGSPAESGWDSDSPRTQGQPGT